jgi:hypothetical protein
MNAAGTRAYVTNSAANRLVTIDIDPSSPAYNTAISTVSTQGLATYPVATTDSKRIFVSNRRNGPVIGNIVVVDADPTSPTYNTIIRTITGPIDPVGMALEGNSLYVADYSGMLYVYDSTTYALKESVAVAGDPRYVAVKDGRIYVTQSDTDSVAVLTGGTGGTAGGQGGKGGAGGNAQAGGSDGGSGGAGGDSLWLEGKAGNGGNGGNGVTPGIGGTGGTGGSAGTGGTPGTPGANGISL